MTKVLKVKTSDHTYHLNCTDWSLDTFGNLTVLREGNDMTFNSAYWLYYEQIK